MSQAIHACHFLRAQGFVVQSSPNVALRVEQPSVVTSFFSELQYSAAFGRESRKFAGVV